MDVADVSPCPVSSLFTRPRQTLHRVQFSIVLVDFALSVKCHLWGIYGRLKEAQENIKKITADKRVETKKINANSLVSRRVHPSGPELRSSV